MTAQVEDRFRYRDVDYSVVGVSEGRLFDIEELGMKPVPATSSCWRGYEAVFAIAESRLVLDSLYASLKRRDEECARIEGPVINGVAPLPAERQGGFNNNYKGINLPLDYTGGVLLGDGFIRSLYMHMGFQDAWKYERVIELIFDRGTLKEEIDRSEEMAKTRKEALESGAYPGPFGTEEEGMLDFIEGSFDLGYDLE